MSPHSEQEIIQTVSQYFQEVLEPPNPSFGNLPICPFFAKVRVQNKILYKVYAFSKIDLVEGSQLNKFIHEFMESTHHEVLHVIHPKEPLMSLIEFQAFMEKLNCMISAQGLIAFGGHPDNPISIKNVSTRSEPFVNFTLQPKKEVLLARKLLSETDYYRNWTPEDLQCIEFPED